MSINSNSIIHFTRKQNFRQGFKGKNYIEEQIVKSGKTCAAIPVNPSLYFMIFFKLLIVSSFLILIFFSCSKPAPQISLPVVITDSPFAITDTTALSGGTISSDGGASIITHGVCWSTVHNPDIIGSHTSDGTGSVKFSSKLTGLTPGTVYHLRAYATNKMGTAYGSEFTFMAIGITPGADVYVGGYEVVGSKRIARVWKNGVIYPITEDPYNAEIKGICVSGTDVYAVGNVHTPDGATIMKVWKNGIATPLPPANAEASSIFVSGTDQYVVGVDYKEDGGGEVWKNGVETDYANGAPFEISGPYSVFVSGTDVYVAGSGRENGSNPIAAIWKNGKSTLLTSYGELDAFALSVYVTNNDVYAAGYQNFSVPSPVFQVPSAKIWKNGIPTALAPETVSAANSIYVSGSDVYVAGYIRKNNVLCAVLWKNGIADYLTDGPNNSFAVSVGVSDNDIYVAGYELGSVGIAKIWKNGIGYSLTDGSTDARAFCMYVK